MDNDNFYNLYLMDLEGIKPYTKEEEQELLKELKAGSPDATNRLIEGSLAKVLHLAKEYENKGVPVADLVQEGNMALTIAVSEFESGKESPPQQRKSPSPAFGGKLRSAESFSVFIEEKIISAFMDAIAMQQLEEHTEEEILARVNVLKKISTMMAEELGREPEVSELAEKMKMTEEEIRGIMKLALDAISVDE